MSYSDEIKSQLCNLPVTKHCCALAERKAIDMMLCSMTRPNIKENLYNRIQILEKKMDQNNDEQYSDNPCCRIAFIRGCFLVGGYVAPPSSEAHLEIRFYSGEICRKVLEYSADSNVDIRSTVKNGRFVIYMKAAQNIADFLAYIGSSKGVLDYSTAMVEKDVRNAANRAVNCDNANIEKLNSTKDEIISLVQKCKKKRVYSQLPEGVAEIINLRVKFPEYSLQELGEMAVPKLSKSGVSHRIRKFREFCKQKNLF